MIMYLTLYLTSELSLSRWSWLFPWKSTLSRPTHIFFFILWNVLIKMALIFDWEFCSNFCASRFEPLLLLKQLRNKRLMFVGDSLNRNQWESLVCMVQSELRYAKKWEDGNRNIFYSKVRFYFIFDITVNYFDVFKF